MKNSECIIKIMGRNGRLYQTYRREKGGWVQTSSNGRARPCTAEQLLSHLLPPLAGASPGVIRVERVVASGSEQAGSHH